jgi:choline monooxygenase
VDPEAHPKNLFFWYLWPNIVINLFPGSNQIMFMSFDPSSADRSEVLVKSYSAGKPLEDYDSFIDMGKRVFQEDKELCESVQRGMHSRAFEQSIYFVDGRKEEATEKAVHYFHKRVWDRLTASDSRD